MSTDQHGAGTGDVEAAFDEWDDKYPQPVDASDVFDKIEAAFKAGAEWGRVQGVPKEVWAVVEAARAVSKCQVKNKKYMELLIAQDRAVLALERVEAGTREQEGGQ